MLWIDDDAHLMSDIAEGFIIYSKNQSETSNIVHEWFKLGNHYETYRNSASELRENAAKVLVMADGSSFGVDDQCLLDLNDESKINDAVSAIIAKYNIVAIDLALMVNDTELSHYNRKEPTKSLSMILCNRLHNAKNADGNPLTVVLYSTFALDGRLNDLWKDAYKHFYGEEDGVNEKFIYARKSLSVNSSTFSEYRARQLNNTIVSGVRRHD
jgi:hypothetical protein